MVASDHLDAESTGREPRRHPRVFAHDLGQPPGLARPQRPLRERPLPAAYRADLRKADGSWARRGEGEPGGEGGLLLLFGPRSAGGLSHRRQAGHEHLRRYSQGTGDAFGASIAWDAKR